ncbi:MULTISPECIES: potassium channel family protein [Shewanella]|uniref:potassium channel family protein n=1 Tax=Shewanella TaxID=22 RepID=UPI00048D4F8F|nr:MULTISPECIES: potassium channel family protein [Shewanella]
MHVQQKINQSNNFFYMTFALVSLLVCSSLVQVMPQGVLEYVVEGFTIVTFIVCLRSLRFDRRWYHFMVLLVVCWLAATLVRNLLDIKVMDLLMLSFMFAFFWGTFTSVARQILFVGHVDRNKIIGSIALFLLLGLMWSLIYLFILEFSPQSFTGVEPQAWGENFSQMAYFSFVTLTTLGYGDISPVTPFAQVAVYMEAIAGVFYMAIVVASLVSAGQAKAEQQD